MGHAVSCDGVKSFARAKVGWSRVGAARCTCRALFRALSVLRRFSAYEGEFLHGVQQTARLVRGRCGACGRLFIQDGCHAQP